MRVGEYDGVVAGTSTVLVFRKTLPVPLCVLSVHGCFIYVPETEGRILAPV